MNSLITISIRSFSISLLISLLASTTSYAQERKLDFSVEYSPYLSEISDGFLNSSFKLSHHFLIRMEFQTEYKFKPYVGFGFLNVGDRIVDYSSPIMDFEAHTYVFNHNYIYLPLGARWDLIHFYLRADLGIAYNISNRIRVDSKARFSSEVFSETQDFELVRGSFNTINIPFGFSIGKSFEIADFVFESGVRGIYSINEIVRNDDISNHYYGFGAFLTLHL